MKTENYLHLHLHLRHHSFLQGIYHMPGATNDDMGTPTG